MEATVTPPTKVCPNCGAQAQTFDAKCPNCGKKYKRRRGGTFVKVMLGVFLGGCLLIAGCVALFAAGVDEAAKEQNETAITQSQFRSVKLGTTQSAIERRLGQPGDAQEFENEGLPGEAVKSSCIYYNEKDKGLGEGRFYQFCFDGNRLTGKNAY
jgi:hypothetical protein